MMAGRSTVLGEGLGVVQLSIAVLRVLQQGRFVVVAGALLDGSLEHGLTVVEEGDQ